MLNGLHGSSLDDFAIDQQLGSAAVNAVEVQSLVINGGDNIALLVLFQIQLAALLADGLELGSLVVILETGLQLSQVQRSLAVGGQLQVIGAGISGDIVSDEGAILVHIIVLDGAGVSLLAGSSLDSLIGVVTRQLFALVVISLVSGAQSESGGAQGQSHDHSKNSCDDLLHV